MSCSCSCSCHLMPSSPPKNTIELHLGELHPLCGEFLSAIEEARDPQDPILFRHVMVTVGSATFLLMPMVEQRVIREGEEQVLTFHLRAPTRGELT